METISNKSTIVSDALQSCPFINKVKTYIDFFNEKLKDNPFEKEEVIFFNENKDLMGKNKVLVLNQRNLMNYIWSYNYFQFLLSGTHYFKFNFIFDNYSDFNDIIRNLANTKFDFPKFEGTIIYQKTIDMEISLLNFEEENITFNLYKGKLNEDTYIYETTEPKSEGISPSDLKKIISGGSADDIFIIEKTRKDKKDTNLKFILQFIFYRIEANYGNFNAKIEETKEKELKSANKRNKQFKEEKISKYCTNNENDIINNFNRNNTGLEGANNINIFILSPAKLQILNNLYNAFNPNQKGMKTIVTNNILPLGLKKFQPNEIIDRFESISSLFGNTENGYLIDKFQQNYLKLLNFYFSSIKAHLFLIYDSFDIITKNFKNPTEEELKTEKFDSFAEDKTKKLKEDILIKIDEIIKTGKKEINKFMEDSFVIMERDLNKITEQFYDIVIKLKEVGDKFIESLQNELNHEYNTKLIGFLKEKGVTSDFFKKIEAILRGRIKIDNPFLHKLNKFKGELTKLLVSFGVSILGGLGAAAGCAIKKFGTKVVADAAAGAIGGPVGAGIGIAVGTIALVGQIGYGLSQNRKKAENLYKECCNKLEETKVFIKSSVEDISKKNLDELQNMGKREIKIIKIMLKYCQQIEIIKKCSLTNKWI